MKRSILFVSLSAVAVGVLAGSARVATSSGQSGALVRLQPTTPGTLQNGHANVSGTVKAGFLKGDGSGITNLPANNIVGQLGNANIPMPLVLVGNVSSGVIMGENQNLGLFSAGLTGIQSAATGSGTGVIGWANSTTGTGILGVAASSTGPTIGVSALNYSTAGTGLLAVANAATGQTFGVQGHSSSTDGVGVLGQVTHTVDNYSRGIGVKGVVDSPNSYDPTYGVYGTINSAYGAGVAGTSTSPLGGVGVRGQVARGIGVLGWANGLSGVGTGGYFRADSDGGWAVVGEATDYNGTGMGGDFTSNGGWGTGISGEATFQSSQTYGVFGRAYSTSYAVFANGKMGASGAKSFRIDHPLDPAHKYLYHYSAEGPEPQNIYNGNIVTDERGEAWVQLPEYYAEINKDPKYQLTVLSGGEDFVQAMIAREIEGNRFKIRTSKPGVKVSWEVKAHRNDRWVREYGTPVESDKEGPEDGRYQHPELYGQEEDKHFRYMPARKRNLGGSLSRASGPTNEQNPPKTP